MSGHQTTLRGRVEVSGVALHGGHPVRAWLCPAKANSGIVFESDGVLIPAVVDNVVDTQMATTLGLSGAKVRTVEHLLATLVGAGLDNVRVVVEGGELPALDGCGQAWLSHIHSAGIVEQGAPKMVLVIHKTVSFRDGERSARLEPSTVLALDLSIDFDHPAINSQRLSLEMGAGIFEAELSWARTFGFERHVAAMHRMGLALGGSLNNAVVFGESGPLNEGGLRANDEPVRHKMLDALGDLRLLGYPLAGRLVTQRPGHGLIVDLVRAVMAEPDAWELCQA
jgi:UDP-3-O-[3-hydroxymyristoyl] N-acetylglucosamine deacetylase